MKIIYKLIHTHTHIKKVNFMNFYFRTISMCESVHFLGTVVGAMGWKGSTTLGLLRCFKTYVIYKSITY